MVEQPVRLLQITDSHLFQDPSQRLLGLDTDESFQAVVELAYNESQSHVIGAVLATGDIAQDGSNRAYKHYQKVIRQFNVPVLWLPGNHDNPAFLNTSVQSSQDFVSPCHYQLGPWSIIMLDSSVPGHVYGRLDQPNLDFLDHTLASIPNQHVMVCLHHHPVDCGALWLDSHNLKNADDLWKVLNQHLNVKVLVWGHIHQDFEYKYVHEGQSIFCYAPPSTCIQFKPNCIDFALDTLNPGYRWFDLYPSGRVETSVSRTVQGFHQDMDSTGY